MRIINNTICCSKIGVAALCLTITQGCSISTYPMDADRKVSRTDACNHEAHDSQCSSKQAVGAEASASATSRGVMQSGKQDNRYLPKQKNTFFSTWRSFFKKIKPRRKNRAARNNFDRLDDEGSTSDTGLESDSDLALLLPVH